MRARPVGLTCPTSLRVLRFVLGSAIVLAFPLAAIAVFGRGVDRRLAADVLACVYAFGLLLLFASSLPLPALRGWTRHERLASASLLFLGVSYATHLSWELAWLLAHEHIAASRDAAWAYPWWAYIDGGDARYLHAPPELLAMETLSVVNGTIGVIALRAWLRARARWALLAMLGTAVVHFYSASLYYLGELVAGLPNVDTTRFVSTWVKFGLANAPWIVMPPLVVAWVWGELECREAGR